jgi:hypothetical protein
LELPALDAFFRDAWRFIGSLCPLLADFVAEVGGDRRVAVVTNFLK